MRLEKGHGSVPIRNGIFNVAMTTATNIVCISFSFSFSFSFSSSSGGLSNIPSEERRRKVRFLSVKLGPTKKENAYGLISCSEECKKIFCYPPISVCARLSKVMTSQSSDLCMDSTWKQPMGIASGPLSQCSPDWHSAGKILAMFDSHRPTLPCRYGRHLNLLLNPYALVSKITSIFCLVNCSARKRNYSPHRQPWWIALRWAKGNMHNTTTPASQSVSQC